MLSFEEIEDCMPDGANAAIDDAGNETGYTLVSAQWLHDFAHAVALKEREACAKLCEATGEFMAQRYGDGAECITTGEECAENIRMRSNAEITGSEAVRVD